MKRRGALSREYLHICRDLHPKVTEIRYGRAQHLHRIEDEAAEVRSGRRLTYDDIERIRNSEVWNADVFGYWPTRTEVESILKSTEWDFWNLPKREDEAIASLLLVFRQIEPVSVILRFIVPKHYGILSPPVEKVLGLGPFRRHPEKYCAYLRNLREIRDVKNFDTAADVDMALWALQLGVLDGLLSSHLPDNEYKALQEGFKQDSKLREIWAGNLTRPLFSDISRVELAEALLGTDLELAGQIAGIEFERSVKRLVQADPDDRLKDVVHGRLSALVRENYQNRFLVTRIIVDCREAVGTRNRAVHPGPALRRERVERLINATKEIGKMEEMKCRPAKAADIDPSGMVADGFSLTPAKFWREPAIAQLVSEQGISAPQRLDGIVGAAADLWDDDEDFDLFVKNIHERRIDGGVSGEGDR